jgi:hypothetical protein
MNAGLTDLSINALAIDPSAPATLYAGTLLGSVFKSMNGGQSWTAVNSGLTGSIVEALVVDSSGPATLYVGTFGGVFKSVDGGGSWTSDERRPDSLHCQCPGDRSLDRHPLRGDGRRRRLRLPDRDRGRSSAVLPPNHKGTPRLVNPRR